jgi:hypothetical protein
MRFTPFSARNISLACLLCLSLSPLCTYDFACLLAIPAAFSNVAKKINQALVVAIHPVREGGEISDHNKKN